MDSLTQIALGAAVGEAVAGRNLGNRALLAGALFGTLPDLDILVPFDDAVASFTYHRSFSHSWLVLTALSPLFAWISYKWVHFRSRETISFARWLLLIFLALNTHVLLDCFTVYGTQALWPLSNYPIGWSTIFIIDPLYTAPLIIGLIVASRQSPLARKRRYANVLGLTLSTLYLGWTVFAHDLAEQRALATLTEKNLSVDKIKTTPTPFSILWRFNVRDEDSYLEGFHALTDRDIDIEFSRYDANEQLYRELENHWPVNRLGWFTRGYYAMSERDNVIYMTDLRMGIEASYVFSFRMARRKSDGALVPEQSALLPFRPDTARLIKVFRRMLDPGVSLLPKNGSVL